MAHPVSHRICRNPDSVQLRTNPEYQRSAPSETAPKTKPKIRKAHVLPGEATLPGGFLRFSRFYPNLVLLRFIIHTQVIQTMSDFGPGCMVILVNKYWIVCRHFLVKHKTSRGLCQCFFSFLKRRPRRSLGAVREVHPIELVSKLSLALVYMKSRG